MPDSCIWAKGKREYLMRMLLLKVSCPAEEEVMEAEELARSMGVIPEWQRQPKSQGA